MSLISDGVSQKLQRARPVHRDVVRLRYFADYGHGFLGLFRALFEGKLDEVIRDPGPPFVDKEHIPVIKKTLVKMASETTLKDKIPSKYMNLVEEDKDLPVSEDCLFPL